MKGVIMEDQVIKLPRTSILSHCDFTANLSLTISYMINLDQVFLYAYLGILSQPWGLFSTQS